MYLGHKMLQSRLSQFKLTLCLHDSAGLLSLAPIEAGLRVPEVVPRDTTHE